MAYETSLNECVVCKEVLGEKTFLLPCLHSTCSKCIGDIISDAQQKGKKAAGCIECNETFVLEKLTIVPQRATVETTANCQVHPDQPIIKYSTTSKTDVCSKCIAGEYASHNLVDLSVAIRSIIAAAQDDVAKLIDQNGNIDKVAEKLKRMHNGLKLHIPDREKKLELHKNIQNYRGAQAKLDARTAEHETHLAEMKQQDKLYILRVEDLSTLKSVVETAKKQVEAIQVIANAGTLPETTVLRLLRVIAARVTELQAGVEQAVSILSPGFDRYSLDVRVSNLNGKTITKIKSGWNEDAYAVCDDGCFAGEKRSWKLTINATNSQNYVMIGVLNSAGVPANSYSPFDTTNFAVGNCTTLKAGVATGIIPPPQFATGDVIELTVDTVARVLTVSNVTQNWTHSIDQLPAPNPAFYPHVYLFCPDDSITIDAIQQ